MQVLLQIVPIFTVIALIITSGSIENQRQENVFLVIALCLACLVVLFPVLDRGVLANAGHILVGQNHELLVRRRLQEELVAALMQHAAQRLSRLNRLATDLKIQAIGKERLKLHARQAALGQQRAVLLNARNDTM